MAYFRLYFYKKEVCWNWYVSRDTITFIKPDYLIEIIDNHIALW